MNKLQNRILLSDFTNLVKEWTKTSITTEILKILNGFNIRKVVQILIIKGVAVMSYLKLLIEV